jgi:hypothetical protein
MKYLALFTGIQPVHHTQGGKTGQWQKGLEDGAFKADHPQPNAPIRGTTL